MDKLEIEEKSVAYEIKKTMETEGWKYLVANWYAEREKIIAEGKKSRTEEKRVQMWSALEAYDRAVLMAEKMSRSHKLNQIQEEINDD